MGSEFPGSPTVLFWENVYLQKYSGDINDGYELPLVDQEILYNGLDSLVIKAAGETTGVPKSDFFNFLETPDYRTPFPDIVHQFVSKVNKIATDIREDNYNFNPYSVLGLGPSRPYYFLPEEIVRGSIRNGFHRNEKPLHCTQKMNGNDPYLEYPGYNCANRKFRFFHAPTFNVPDWDGIGPKYHEVGVHHLGVDARLHNPRCIWPGFRTDQEDDDARVGRVRLNDCFMCRSYEILYNLGVKRFRKKAKMRAAGVKFPNTTDTDIMAPKYTSNASTQTDRQPLINFCLPCFQKENPRGVNTPSRGEIRKKRTGMYQRQRSLTPTTPEHLCRPKEATQVRSSSVDSPIRTSTQNSCSRRSLFEETSKGEKEKSKVSPKVPENATTGQGREADAEKTTPRGGKNFDIFEGVHYRAAPVKETKEDRVVRLRKDRRNILAEIDRQDAERRKEHADNKRNKKFHLCPKLNWESSSSIALTDSSCNSTCECVKNDKILKDMAAKDSALDSSATSPTSTKTPQSSFLHEASITGSENSVQKKPVKAVEATPKNKPEKFLIQETADLDSEMIGPTTALEPRYYTQVRNDKTTNWMHGATAFADVATMKYTETQKDEVKPNSPEKEKTSKDDDEEDDDEEENDEEDDDEEENDDEDDDEEEADEEPSEDDESSEEDSSDEQTADEAATPDPKKEKEGSKKEKSPGQIAYEHLLEVNNSGVDLDVSKLPENACVLTYSPKSGVNFRTLSMEPEEDLPDEAIEQNESAETGSKKDAGSSPQLPAPSQTPKKISPKRPHSSPEKATNQAKKIQSELPSNDPQSSELFLTQVENIPEYLTTRDWEKKDCFKKPN